MKLARLCLVVLLSFGTLLTGCNQSPTEQAQEQQKLPPLKERITAHFVKGITDQKQQIFDSIHPVGTAKSVKFHDFVFTWKNDKESENENDLLRVDVRYTIYWDGLVQKDGYTKIEASYDAESERWTGKLLATSGMTKDDVAYGVGFAVGAAIKANSE